MKGLFLVFLLSLSSSLASTPGYKVFISERPISVSSDLHSWYLKYINDVKNDHAGNVNSTQCSEAKELRVLICQSYLSGTMNSALTRASVFVEGLFDIKTGTLIKTTHPLVSKKRLLLGHDLQKKDLKTFLKVVNEKCPEDRSYCLNGAESALFTKLKPFLDSDSDFVLIATFIRPFLFYKRTINHEFLHAQYFLNLEYRRIVDKYWEGLNIEEKKIFKKGFPIPYDESNDFLIKNEFQAYLLSGGYLQSSSEFFLAHKTALKAKLRGGSISDSDDIHPDDGGTLFGRDKQ